MRRLGWGEAKCEAIVPEEQWNEVNKIIEEQLKQWKKPGKVPVNPFGNRLWCQCGGKMYERKHIGKFHCRACNRKVPVEDFERRMREELHQFYGSSQQVALHMEDAGKNLVEKGQALASLQRQIQKLREEMNKMMRLCLDGHITEQALGQYHRPAEEQLDQLQSGLPRLEAEVSGLKVKHVSAEEIIYEAKTLYELWPKLDADRKRSIVEAVFERIEYWDGKLRITYSGIPTSEELCKNQQQMAPATC